MAPKISAFRAGSRLSSGFRLERDLGRTSSGERWQAVGSDGKRVVILIVSHADVSQAKQILEAVAGLEHPNLILPENSWSDKDHLYVVMELTRAGTLQSRLAACRLKEQSGIPKSELLGYFQDLARGLDFLHSRHILHREVQSDNMMLKKGSVKLTNLSLSDPNARGRVSDWKYAPPERFAGEMVPASDQYSLAIAWIELRLDRPLFPRATTQAQFQEAQAEAEPNLGDLSDSEQQVLLKALHRDPSRRFATCGIFVSGLAAASEARVPKKSKTPPTAKAPKPKNARRPILTFTGVLLVGGIVVLAAFLLIMAEMQKQRRDMADEVAARLEKGDFAGAAAKFDAAGMLARITSPKLRDSVGNQWRDSIRKQMHDEKRWQRNEFANTEKSLSNLLERFPNHPDVGSTLALAKQGREILEHLDEGRFQEAAALLPNDGDDVPKVSAFLVSQVKQSWADSAEKLATKDTAAARAAMGDMRRHFKNLGPHEALSKQTLNALTKQVDGLLADTKYAEARKLRDTFKADAEGVDAWNRRLESHLGDKVKALLEDGKSVDEAVSIRQSFQADLPDAGKKIDRSIVDGWVPRGRKQFAEDRQGAASAKQYARTQEQLESLLKHFPKSEAVAKLRQEIFMAVRQDAESAVKEGRHDDSLQHLASARNFTATDAQRSAIDQQAKDLTAAQFARTRDLAFSARLKSIWHNLRKGDPALRCVR